MLKKILIGAGAFAAIIVVLLVAAVMLVSPDFAVERSVFDVGVIDLPDDPQHRKR